ncbi:hypothetical protein B0H63DRAFT_464257 [Podospora didyma]|uniref:FAD-binding PCMH-type domain-containing protein n=1 Tax=Podospora didyma TaxID=330526 RepID=A0AAE0NXR7_9PEZI|nr:hypothetical protein B0H63DRAFT_464257 [Podospora didyma]
MSNTDEIIKILKDLKIPVFKAGEEPYERSVATSNLLHRYSRPACVVQPKNATHVRNVINEAKARGISITIKNGGHSYAGFSTADKGISLDLCKMKEVTLDMATKTVTLQGGALWGHAYKTLVNGRHDGYIINGGRCPTVGVSGFTLGGGLGPFTRMFGMGCDTLQSATLITASGTEVTVKKTDDPKSDKGKLFWALCGAGGGNFGVLVSMTLKLQQLSNPDGHVVAGRYTWYPDLSTPAKITELTTTMNNFYTADWPDQLTIDSSWLCELARSDPTGHSPIGVRFLVYYDGNQQSFRDLIDTHITHPELAKQLKRRSLVEKSTRFLHETLVSQWSEETIKAFPTNRSYSIYSSFVFKNNNPERISAITGLIQSEMAAFRALYPGETALLQVTWIHSGGQASRKPRSATAFRWRDAVYHAYIMVQWEDKWLEGDMREFLGRFRVALRPYSMMKEAAFINFPDETLLADVQERAYYGNNRQELQRVKHIWDKDNYWNWVQGVKLPPPKDKEEKATEVTSSVRFQPEVRPVSSMRASNVLYAETSFTESLASSSWTGGRVIGKEEDVVHQFGPVHAQDELSTDVLAAEQWDSFEHPPAQSTLTFSMGGGQVLRGLTDLGF